MLQLGDLTFDGIKGEKKYARKVLENDKFLGVEESTRQLI